jgi:hypothetical protein
VAKGCSSESNSSLAVAASAVILVVASVPPREEPLPGDAVEASDPQVVRLYDGARRRVRAEPASAEAWGDLGLVLAAHGHASDATECLGRAAALAPADWRGPCFKAAVESDVDLDRAVDTMAEEIRRDPRQEWPRLCRARWLEQLGRAAAQRRHRAGRRRGGAREARTREPRDVRAAAPHAVQRGARSRPAAVLRF